MSENRCTIKCNGHFDLILNAEKLGMHSTSHCDIVLVSGNKVYLIELKAWKADLEPKDVKDLIKKVNNKFHCSKTKVEEILSCIKDSSKTYNYEGYLVYSLNDAGQAMNKNEALHMRAMKPGFPKVKLLESGSELFI